MFLLKKSNRKMMIPTETTCRARTELKADLMFDTAKSVIPDDRMM